MNNKFYMAKSFISFMLVALVAAFQSAKADNKVYIESFSAIPGNETVRTDRAFPVSATVDFFMENSDAVSSLMFDFALPEGMEFSEIGTDGNPSSFAKNTARLTRSGHMVLVRQIASVDGVRDTYRCGIFEQATDPAKSAIKLNEGALLSMDFYATPLFKGGNLDIFNVIGSDNTTAESKQIVMENSTVKVDAIAGEFSLDQTAITLAKDEVKTITFMLNNYIEVNGLEAEIVLPEGIEIAPKDEEEEFGYTDRLSLNTTIVGNETEYGKKIIISSLTNDVFEGSEGALFSFDVKAVSAPVDDKIIVQNVKVSSTASVSYKVTGNGEVSVSVDAEADPSAVTLDVERYVGLGYAATTAEVDFTEAKAFLGVDEITTDILRIVNPDGTLISDYSPYDGWFNAEGVAETWGANTKVCVKFFQALENGEYEICDMNGADELGATYSVKWALVANDKQVTYTINVKFVEAPIYAPEIISTIDVPVTVKPATVYEGATVEFPAADVASALGLESIDDADQYIVNVTDGNFVVNSTDGWRNAEGDAANWGSGDGMVCVKINDPASGMVDYIGAIDETYAEGATFTAKWGFVNSEDKAVVLNINITFSNATGIAAPEAASAAKKDGKYLENGKVVIYSNGNKFNAAGAEINE